MEYHYSAFLLKSSKRVSILTGAMGAAEMLKGNESAFIENFRLPRKTLGALLFGLINRGVFVELESLSTGAVCRTQNGTGYTNLTPHIEREHPGYLNYDATAPISEQNLFMPLFARSVRNVYGWLTCITPSLLPFNFCENDMARRYSNLGPISNKTLMKWMHHMCRWLEAKLK
ncbi:hypothetical protein B5M09_012757 [Aphanomyces astaci]|uniref:Uncharacterized protein n=1 Tax=Aphanomyces astaci TaxID=112090 RepID=A0A425DP74_APHAT|nr:hypothetical protein B5M09_012757 [Aphanomyces astaci]